MKKLLFLLVALLVGLTSACKKDKDPEPVKPAVAVAGTYTLSAFRFATPDGNINLPTLPTTVNGRAVSGTVVFEQVSGQDAKANMTVTLKVSGQQDIAIDPIEVAIEGTGPYTLKLDGQAAGKVEGNTATFNFSETTPQGQRVELSFTGRK